MLTRRALFGAFLSPAAPTEDEAVEAAPTAPWDEVWGGGFINPETFTRHVHRMLSAD